MEESELKKLEYLGEYCPICGAELTTWDAKCSHKLQYIKMLCERCISDEYDITIESFRAKMEDAFGIKPCVYG
jgi:hypothetical protein